MKRKLPWVVGVAAGLVAAGVWCTVYAGTPQDPQKGVGYVVIVALSAVFGVMAGLVAQALSFFREGRTSEGVVSLLPAASGLLLAVGVMLGPPASHRQAEKSTDPIRLRGMAEDALMRKDMELLEKLARNPSLPSQARAKLANHPDARIRALATEPPKER